MNYEVVTLEEKTVVGISARTNNMSPDMGMVIGGMWQSFYEKGIYAAIAEKKTDKALGIYADYAGDEMDDYTFLVACEVDGAEHIPESTVCRSIPAGKYAKFVVIGDMKNAVVDFWQKLWEMKLPRSFVCDFEEYQDCNMDQAEIHIYIGLKG